MNSAAVKRIGLGIGLLLLTVIVARWGGAWLQQELLRPLVVGWVWFVFYVLHLPQAAVWFAVLLLAALSLLKRLKLLPKVALPQRHPGPRGAKGPLSAWHQTLTLALKGKFYRKKLYLYLRDQFADLARVSPQARTALEQLKASDNPIQRPSVRDGAAFLRALHSLLDELDVPGASHAAD